jgi:hypothetical protein
MSSVNNTIHLPPIAGGSAGQVLVSGDCGVASFAPPLPKTIEVYCDDGGDIILNNAPVKDALKVWNINVDTASVSITKLINVLLKTISFEDLYNILTFNNINDELEFLTEAINIIKNNPKLIKELEERKFVIEGNILENV